MTANRITVVRGALPLPAPETGEVVVTDGDLRRWTLNGGIWRQARRFRTARLLTERLSTSGRPMLAWALRLLAQDRCYIADVEGRERDITLPLLVRWSAQVVREAATKASLLRRVQGHVAAAESTVPARVASPWNRGAHPVYLRTDLSFGVRAGGSVGHIAGVLNQFVGVGARPILITTSDVPTLSPEVEVHNVTVPEAFWNFQELPTFVLNDASAEQAIVAIAGRPVSLVYQRYSLNNFAGLRLARRFGVPLVLEYNGSEIWMSRHWGRPLANEPLSDRIERLNLRAASLVVVVSRAMKEEILARGADERRVLVNPNGVDAERYRPDVNGSPVRARYGLDGSVVLGFIGTFGPWHGAEMLARAYVRLRALHPLQARRVRLLMIGAGARMAEVRRILAEGAALEATSFTGLVPQEEGPAHLAACDVLISPHVPNPDGTPFFGSPTKLFEYMAMGRGIVASNLDQIGEVLEHNRTALLVPPGDPDALASAVARLSEDHKLRESLGAEARRVVLEQHTWRAHTQRTIDCLTQVAG